MNVVTLEQIGQSESQWAALLNINNELSLGNCWMFLLPVGLFQFAIRLLN